MSLTLLTYQTAKCERTNQRAMRAAERCQKRNVHSRFVRASFFFGPQSCCFILLDSSHLAFCCEPTNHVKARSFMLEPEGCFMRLSSVHTE